MACNLTRNVTVRTRANFLKQKHSITQHKQPFTSELLIMLHQSILIHMTHMCLFMTDCLV